MISFNEVEDKIKEYSSNGEWGKILDLIDCKDFINDNIDDKLKSRLYYYYANIAKDVAGIIGSKNSNDEINADSARNFVKYYNLFNKAKAITFKSLQNKDRNTVLRTIAYFYKTIYESKLWSPKMFRIYPKEIQDKLNSDGYTLTYFRDIALYFYYLCLNRDSNDIKTNYRYACLLRELIQNALNKGTKRDEDGKLLPVNYTASLINHLSPQTLKQYTVFLDKNKIPVMHIGFNNRKDLDYYNKTIKLWEECRDKREKDRTQAEYLKALYAFCRYHSDRMLDINISLANLDYSMVDNCFEAINNGIRYNNQRETLSMGDSVNNKLKIIFNTLKFPLTAAELSKPCYVEDKIPVQTNFFYYTLAKYYISYGVNHSSGEDNLRAALKASYFSVLANYYMSTIKNRNKSVNKWPYVLFVKILEGLNLFDELNVFHEKFQKIGKKDMEYLNMIREIAVSFYNGKYSKCKAIGLRYIKNNRMAPAERSVIQKMIDRADAFINDPNLIQKNRDIKAKQILAKNTLAAIGFYKRP